MPEKKKQHYVPQFYLRLFSCVDKKSINIYNICSRKIIFGGNLKNQCYKTYFYGQNPDIENAFSCLESGVSQIIAQIIGSNAAPKHDTSEYCDILAYTLLQCARTRYAAEAETETTDTVVKSILKDSGTIPHEKLDHVKIESENPTALPLRTMAQLIPVAMDLICKVLVNKTSLNFITSDNPVVFCNRACEQSKVFSHTGLANKGLKIIFPISPKHILFFYDEKIYKVGARKCQFSDVAVKNDVQQFNDLQWLNAHENIYFNDSSLQPEILRGISKNIKKRNTEKYQITEYQERIKENEMQKTFLLIQKPELNMRMNMHCIKQIRTLTEEEMNDGTKSIRNPALYYVHNEFMKFVDEDKYKANEFGKFINDRQKSENKPMT